MIGQFLQAGFYAMLAIFVTGVNWHRLNRYAGIALLIYSLISSGTFFLVDFEWRVIREIGLATLMAIVSFDLWIEGEARRSNQAVMALCTLNLTFCGAICFYQDDSFQAQLLFAYGVNVIFLGMCAAVATPGIRDVVRGWIRTIDDLRRRDSSTPDFDWLLSRMRKD